MSWLAVIPLLLFASYFQITYFVTAHPWRRRIRAFPMSPLHPAPAGKCFSVPQICNFSFSHQHLKVCLFLPHFLAGLGMITNQGCVGLPAKTWSCKLAGKGHALACQMVSVIERCKILHDFDNVEKWLDRSSNCQPNRGSDSWSISFLSFQAWRLLLVPCGLFRIWPEVLICNLLRALWTWININKYKSTCFENALFLILLISLWWV